MQNKYKEQIKKFEKFNKWEEQYIKSLSSQEKLEQFVVLFDLQNYLPPEQVERYHQEHLDNLIETQKIFSLLKEMKIAVRESEDN